MYPKGLAHKPYFLPIPVQLSLWGKYSIFLTILSHHKCLWGGLVVITNLRLFLKGYFIMKLSNIQKSGEGSIMNLLFTNQFPELSPFCQFVYPFSFQVHFNANPRYINSSINALVWYILNRDSVCMHVFIFIHTYIYAYDTTTITLWHLTKLKLIS